MTIGIKFKFYEKKGNSYEPRLSEDYLVDSEGRIYYANFGDNYLTDVSSDMIAVQYTRFRDIHGTKIFEGNVVYICGFGNYQVKDIRADYHTLLNASVENDLGEIIGDIYQNPELFKEENND